MLALFDGMTSYLILTNPWGAGDDASKGGGGDTTPVRTQVRADQPGAADAIGPSSRYLIHREYIDLNDDIKDLADPRYRPNRRAHEERSRHGGQ